MKTPEISTHIGDGRRRRAVSRYLPFRSSHTEATRSNTSTLRRETILEAVWKSPSALNHFYGKTGTLSVLVLTAPVWTTECPYILSVCLLSIICISNTRSRRSTTHVHAEGILQGISTALQTVDLTLEELASIDAPGLTLVFCNFDGASVMMGCRNGVQAKLKDISKCDIISVHCVAHHLKLAILDDVKDVHSVTNFEQIVKWLHLFYSKYYVKNRRDIKEVASVLELVFVHMPEIKEIEVAVQQGQSS